MTDRDEIELPPLPPLPPFGIAPIADEQTVRDYARAAVLADRKRREPPPELVKPKVHSERIGLSSNGYVWSNPPFATSRNLIVATVILRWTDDGRVWIDNKRNRELAKWLRMWQGATGNEAADALDGGVR